MNFSQLDGLTLENLYETIINSPAGFSVEDGSVQYIGRQIQLQDGLTVLSESSSDTTASKNLFDRIVNLHPDFKELLPDSKSEAIKRCARQLMKDFTFFHAIKNSPTKEVQFAIANEEMNKSMTSALNNISETDAFSAAEKFRIFLSAEERGRSIPQYFWASSGIPLSMRLEKTKEMFQNIPDTPPFDRAVKPIHNVYIQIPVGLKFKYMIKELRDLFKSENNELSRQLLKKVNNLEEKYIQKVSAYGSLEPWDLNKDCNRFANNLLYLYTACAGFLKGNVDELASYITSILNSNPTTVTHYVKELCYLSKQPGAVGYARYIDAVANILKKPEQVVSNYEDLEQLSDTRGFSLLQSGKTLTPYLTALKADIENMAPEYSDVLLPEVARLERAEKSLTKSEPNIRALVHRLLLVIAACKSSEQKIDASLLAPCVQAIMKHRNKKDIPYLISGLARLVQSTPKIQQILGGLRMKGSDHLQLAPLPLLALVPDDISEDGLGELCKFLQASGTGKRHIKDSKVFHQWLVTLDQASASQIPDKTMPILTELTKNLTFEKLGLLYMAFKQGERFYGFMESIGFSSPKEGLPLLIAKNGADALGTLGKGSKKVSDWLLKQRYFHLLPCYMASVMDYCNRHRDTKLVDLVHEFLKASSNKTFIKNRQSSLNNPHLEAIYQKYPKFKSGWGANFSKFSKDTRNQLLSPGETLELTEDPWDLFISGLEVKTCQSPENNRSQNLGLMGYVMDGRNAMIVKKSKKGNILSRSLIRMVFDENDHPALFLEMAYPEKSNLLFIDAAREIATEMELPLYHRVDSEEDEADEELTLLKGRAPFEYFDPLGSLMVRKTITFSEVKRDVTDPSQASPDIS